MPIFLTDLLYLQDGVDPYEYIFEFSSAKGFAFYCIIQFRFESSGRWIRLSNIVWIFTLLVCACINFIFQLKKSINVHKKM